MIDYKGEGLFHSMNWLFSFVALFQWWLNVSLVQWVFGVLVHWWTERSTAGNCHQPNVVEWRMNMSAYDQATILVLFEIILTVIIHQIQCVWSLGWASRTALEIINSLMTQKRVKFFTVPVNGGPIDESLGTDHSFLSSKPVRNQFLRLIGVANFDHGYDKLVRGFCLYHKFLPKFLR